MSIFLLWKAKKGAPQSGAPGEALYAVSILAQVGGGVGIGALAEVEVVAGQDGVEDDTGDGGNGQGGQGDGGTAHLEGQAAGEAQPQTRMTAAMIRLRLLVKSTWFSTTFRTPMAEIMP